MAPHRSQRGTALIMALVMLVVLSMIAISATRSSNSSIRIVGNMQIQNEAATAGQLAIEATLNSIANFIPPTTSALQAYNVSGATYYVSVNTQCQNETPMSGYSATMAGSAPNMNYYDVAAAVFADSAGTQKLTTIHQGVRIPLEPYQGC
jgi:Tfp pilus assembly protein PilX